MLADIDYVFIFNWLLIVLSLIISISMISKENNHFNFCGSLIFPNIIKLISIIFMVIELKWTISLNIRALVFIKFWIIILLLILDLESNTFCYSMQDLWNTISLWWYHLRSESFSMWSYCIIDIVGWSIWPFLN